MMEVDNLSWFAIRTKTTHEKRVESLLEYPQYECFLPIYVPRRRWSDRIKEVEFPLFPGYVFCRFDVHAHGPVLKTPSVMGIAGVGARPIPVDDHEIAAIQCVHHAGLAVVPHFFLQVGQRVRISGGSLDGVEGVIEDAALRNRLIASVNLLQRSVAVEIDSAWVKPEQASPNCTVYQKPIWEPVS
jgi:transcription antitermination factor NusG